MELLDSQMDRITVINDLINALGYRSYLEIGCGQNECFDRVTAAHKVGVDPRQGGTLRASSDAFFGINQEKFDLIFIDGLHEAAQVERDLTHALACLNPNGTIVVHDLNPSTPEMQLVPRTVREWTGDCWKGWVKFRSQRSDLAMFVIEADWGIGIVRHGRQALIELPAELTYDELEKNRRSWLNLTDPNQFGEWLSAQKRPGTPTDGQSAGAPAVFQGRPVDISVVVVIHNMLREAPRTLRSLSPDYQREAAGLDYEIVIVDNGSAEPLPPSLLEELGPRYKYHYLESGTHSPVHALNEGVRRAGGNWLGLMIDGARLLSPGLLHLAALAMRVLPNPIISTHGWHLGPDLQYRSVQAGYCKQEEDRLLDQIDWFHHGYRLFEIATFAASSSRGWFLGPAESSCLFVSRSAFNRLGGLDEGFASPGGGLASIDFFRRAREVDGAQPITLLGEGTYHQLHGGIFTNNNEQARRDLMEAFKAEYERLRKQPFHIKDFPALLFGHFPPAAAKQVLLSAQHFLQANPARAAVMKTPA